MLCVLKLKRCNIWNKRCWSVAQTFDWCGHVNTLKVCVCVRACMCAWVCVRVCAWWVRLTDLFCVGVFLCFWAMAFWIFIICTSGEQSLLESQSQFESRVTCRVKALDLPRWVNQSVGCSNVDLSHRVRDVDWSMFSVQTNANNHQIKCMKDAAKNELHRCCFLLQVASDVKIYGWVHVGCLLQIICLKALKLNWCKISPIVFIHNAILVMGILHWLTCTKCLSTILWGKWSLLELILCDMFHQCCDVVELIWVMRVHHRLLCLIDSRCGGGVHSAQTLQMLCTNITNKKFDHYATHECEPATGKKNKSNSEAQKIAVLKLLSWVASGFGLFQRERQKPPAIFYEDWFAREPVMDCLIKKFLYMRCPQMDSDTFILHLIIVLIIKPPTLLCLQGEDTRDEQKTTDNIQKTPRIPLGQTAEVYTYRTTYRLSGCFEKECQVQTQFRNVGRRT